MARKRRLAMHREMMHANVHIGEVRTSISLDPVVWEAVCDIAGHQGKTETQLLPRLTARAVLSVLVPRSAATLWSSTGLGRVAAAQRNPQPNRDLKTGTVEQPYR